LQRGYRPRPPRPGCGQLSAAKLVKLAGALFVVVVKSGSTYTYELRGGVAAAARARPATPRAARGRDGHHRLSPGRRRQAPRRPPPAAPV